MAELTGFSAVEKLGADLGPQSIRVPSDKAAAIAAASQLVEAFFDVVDAGLTPNLMVEFLKHPATGSTYCRITPGNADGFTHNGVAGPGQWVAVDGSRLVAMSNEEYASHFTQDMPIEWASTSVAPSATVDDAGKVTLLFPQPTSANRPFEYTVHRAAEVVATLPAVVADGAVTLPLELTLAEGESAALVVTVTATKYGTSAESATVTAVRPAAVLEGGS